MNDHSIPISYSDFKRSNSHECTNVVTDKVVKLWRTRRAKDVQTYQFPADLGLGHDIISVTDPNMNVAAVYPKLLELIDR
jgi:hypothetical protein